MDGSFTKSRSGSVEMFPGWLGSVLSGTPLGPNHVYGISSGKPLTQRDKLDENKAATTLGKTENFFEKDSVPEVINYKSFY